LVKAKNTHAIVNVVVGVARFKDCSYGKGSKYQIVNVVVVSRFYVLI